MGKEKKQYNIEIGRRIQQSRRGARLTQENLSESIGVTPQYLSDLERGVVGASVPTLISICNTLHVSSDFILFGRSPVEKVLIETKQSLHLSPDHLHLIERAVNLVLESYQLGQSETSRAQTKEDPASV